MSFVAQALKLSDDLLPVGIGGIDAVMAILFDMRKAMTYRACQAITVIHLPYDFLAKMQLTKVISC